MDFKDFLIYLAMAFLGITVVGLALSFAVNVVVSAYHKGTSALHCDECALKATLFAKPKDEGIYSSKGES